LSRLVIGPQTVAKRFDDVIGRDTEVGRSFLEHLEHRVQDADYGPERGILLVEATKAIEVAEELVRAVEKMDDHSALLQGGDVGDSFRFRHTRKTRAARAVAREYGPPDFCATCTRVQAFRSLGSSPIVGAMRCDALPMSNVRARPRLFGNGNKR